MCDLSGLICLVFILFVIVGKSLLKGGAHSRSVLLRGNRVSMFKYHKTVKYGLYSTLLEYPSQRLTYQHASACLANKIARISGKLECDVSLNENDHFSGCMVWKTLYLSRFVEEYCCARLN